MNGDVGVSRNNCNVSFLHSEKSDIWTAVAEMRGGNYNVSLFTRANGNLSCDSSHIENNQSVNKALLNEILVLCSTLVFI